MTLATVGLAVLGTGIVAFGAYTFWRSRFGRPAPGAETLRATIADVRPGGAIRLGGFGDDKEDVELGVQKLARVRLTRDGKTEEWREAEGTYRGRTLRVEWRSSPEHGLRVLAFRKTGVPLEEASIEPALLEPSKPGAKLSLRGGTAVLEESGDAIRESGESLAVKTWLFHDEDKREVVRVERVGEKPATASLGVPVAPDAIEIVRLTG